MCALEVSTLHLLNGGPGLVDILAAIKQTKQLKPYSVRLCTYIILHSEVQTFCTHFGLVGRFKFFILLLLILTIGELSQNNSLYLEIFKDWWCSLPWLGESPKKTIILWRRYNPSSTVPQSFVFTVELSL